MRFQESMQHLLWRNKKLSHSKQSSKLFLKQRLVRLKVSEQKFLQTLLRFYLVRARSNLSFRRSVLLKKASLVRKLLLKTLTKQNLSEVSCFRKLKLANISQGSLTSMLFVHRVIKISQNNTSQRSLKILMPSCWNKMEKLANSKQSYPTLMKSYLQLLKHNQRLPTRILNYLHETQQSPCLTNKLKKCKLKSKAQRLIQQI